MTKEGMKELAIRLNNAKVLEKMLDDIHRLTKAIDDNSIAIIGDKHKVNSLYLPLEQFSSEFVSSFRELLYLEAERMSREFDEL